MNLADRLNQRMDELSLTQELLAKRAKVSQTAIHKLCTGKAKQTRKLVQIAKALSVNPEWLESGTGDMDGSMKATLRINPTLTGHLTDAPSNAQSGTGNTSPVPLYESLIPLISWVQAGAFCSAIDLFHPGDAEVLLPCPKKLGPHAYALRVEGDLMVSPYPGMRSYPPGTIIYVDPDREVINGSRVIAKIPDEETATFKVYVEEGAKRWLKPLNPQYPLVEMTEGMQLCGVVSGGSWDE